jgi:SPP1 gp7 family putative phage head morphogenesis protein
MKQAVEYKADALAERAQMIARTETTSVQSAASVNEMQALGVKRHQWSSALSPTTRDSHASLHGKVVEIGESFRSDITLRYPGDPAAPAAEVVNCACAVIPVID